mmetsp:Transcript_13032/g.31080  ORF Transcript_13032/g.31080 Transcript_13032/m.31080 type:complete len:218 (-) Transcript_13032:539-1192(-)
MPGVRNECIAGSQLAAAREIENFWAGLVGGQVLFTEPGELNAAKTPLCLAHDLLDGAIAHESRDPGRSRPVFPIREEVCNGGLDGVAEGLRPSHCHGRQHANEAHAHGVQPLDKHSHCNGFQKHGTEFDNGETEDGEPHHPLHKHHITNRCCAKAAKNQECQCSQSQAYLHQAHVTANLWHWKSVLLAVTFQPLGIHLLECRPNQKQYGQCCDDRNL